VPQAPVSRLNRTGRGQRRGGHVEVTVNGEGVQGPIAAHSWPLHQAPDARERCPILHADSGVPPVYPFARNRHGQANGEEAPGSDVVVVVNVEDGVDEDVVVRSGARLRGRGRLLPIHGH
jgi:hypothetical protein